MREMTLDLLFYYENAFFSHSLYDFCLIYALYFDISLPRRQKKTYKIVLKGAEMVRKTKSSYTVRFPEDRDSQVKEAAAKKGLSVPNFIILTVLESLSAE